MKKLEKFKNRNDHLKKVDLSKIPKDANLDPVLRAASNYNKIAESGDPKQIKQNAKIDKESLDDFLKYIPKGGVILDIGCGLGIDTAYFHSCGYKTYGIDISENAINLAKQVYPECNYSVGDMSDPKLYWKYQPDGVYECLSLMNLPKSTIESVIKSIYDNLPEGGVFKLTVEEDPGESKTGWYSVPHSQPLMWKGEEVYMVDFIYLSYFKRDEIVSMLLKPGFEILNIKHEKKDNVVSKAITILCRKKVSINKLGIFSKLINFFKNKF